MALKGANLTVFDFPERYRRFDAGRGIEEAHLPILGRLGLNLNSISGFTAARDRFEQLWKNASRYPNRDEGSVRIIHGLEGRSISHVVIGLVVDSPDGSQQVKIEVGRQVGRLVEGYLGSWSSPDDEGGGGEFGVALQRIETFWQRTVKEGLMNDKMTFRQTWMVCHRVALWEILLVLQSSQAA